MARRIRALALVLMPLLLVQGASPLRAPLQEPEGFVVLCPITGTIDDGVLILVERALRAGRDAEAVLFLIDTPGGRVDSAVEITSRILESPTRTIAYITGMGAISAGALIAYACQDMVMAPGSNIGASAVIMITPEGVVPAGEKATSFIRGKYRSLAERNGHNPDIAEAMVDEDIELRGWLAEDGSLIVRAAGRTPDVPLAPGTPPEGRVMLPSGKLLTLSVNEALEWGLITAQASTRADALVSFDYGHLEWIEIEPTWSEALFRWLINPTVAGILLLLGIGGLYFEVRTPGFGLPGIIGATCLILFFGARVVVGLAGWADILLVVLGVALIVIEAFLLPGVGVVGGLGVVLFLLGIYMTSTRVPIPQYYWDFARLRDLAYTLTLSLGGFLLLAYFATRLLPKTPLFQRLVLSNEMTADAGFVVQTDEDETAVGLEGVALTDLRPAGRGRFEGRTRSVVSRGEYVNQGTRIRVIRAEGNRYVVDPIQE